MPRRHLGLALLRPGNLTERLFSAAGVPVAAGDHKPGQAPGFLLAGEEGHLAVLLFTGAGGLVSAE